MRSWFLILACLMLSVLSLYGQDDAVERMKRQKAEIERQVAASEKLLSSTDRDIKSQVASLNVLSERLKGRRKLLDQVKQEVRSLTLQVDELDRELRKLQKEYGECQERYAEACRFHQKQKASLDPLMFLFSSQDYRQLTRRLRYLKEYSGSLHALADEISAKQREIGAKRQEIEKVRNEKLQLQEELTRQEASARSEEQKQKQLIDKLKSKSSSLKKEISRQQKEITALGKEIDRQIAEAIRKSKAAKKTKEESEVDLKLSGSFESNKGRLPVPITGPYLVVGNYGMQSVAGMKDVRLNNLGIDLQGEPDAEARSVFDGEVTTVFQQGKGQIGVLVRHGSYISVYCNLKSTDVVKGDKVKTGDTIGTVGTDSSGKTVLHFQLHKETQKLNPSDWIKK
ncbi:MAG: peptidoglycan DD-metalloendopeptidase family protein [Bacteroidaceae bacterium]|nr:peptidoglycan DD-metalloendopeptidase family protein [Bacteroidaceae bacterium]